MVTDLNATSGPEMAPERPRDGVFAARVRHRRSFDRRILLLVPAVLICMGVMVYPVALLLLKSLTFPTLGLQNYVALFTDTLYIRVIWNTVEVSVLVTLFCVLIGFPYARVIANASPSARRCLVFTILVPLWTSTLVRTFAWLVLLQRDGAVNGLLLSIGLIDEPLALINNRLGVIIGMVQVLLPFMVLPLFSVMVGIDNRYEKAAASLGANPVRAFIRVYLPMTLPGLLNGAVLVFVLCLGYFITPALLGGSTEVMIAQLIQLQVNEFGNWGAAGALSVMLMLAVGVTFGIVRRVVGPISKR